MEDECQHMMTRIKLNYYRAEEEMLIMERLRWRREAEARRKRWKKTEKELNKLRVQESIGLQLLMMIIMMTLSNDQ